MTTVTIQIGQLSNFVGQHMWNAHVANVRARHVDGSEALDDAEKAIPRCLVVDFGHSLGQLSLDSGVVASATHNRKVFDEGRRAAQAAWPGAVHVFGDNNNNNNNNDGDDDVDVDPPVFEYTHRLTGATIAADEALDTPFWSDYSLVRYRRNSLHQLHEHQLANVNEFGGFATGERVWARDAEADELDNRLRVLFESCDRVAAVTMLCDVDDSFGGVAAQMLFRLSDEVPKAWQTAFAFLNKDSAAQAATPAIAGVRALSINALQQHASLFSIVSPLAAQCRFAPQPRNNLYRAAAVLATPLQAFLDGPRRLSRQHDAASVAKMLSHTRNLFALRASIPFAETELFLTPPPRASSWTYGAHASVYAVSFAGRALAADVDARPATMHERFDASFSLPRSHPAHRGARIPSTSVRVEAGAPTYLGRTLAAMLDDAGRGNRSARRLCGHANGVEEDDVLAALADIENAFDVPRDEHDELE